MQHPFLGGSKNAEGDNQLRITFNKGGLYGRFKKFYLYVTTNGVKTLTVDINTYDSSSAKTNIGENISLLGWGGWNVINCDFLFGYTYAQKIEFLFKQTTPNEQYGNAAVATIFGYMNVIYSAANTLSKTVICIR